MSMKRQQDVGTGLGLSRLGKPSTKKCCVTYSTFLKWQTELDKDCQSGSWLDCEVNNEGGKRVVAKLRCKVCLKFKAKITGRRNYSDKCVMVSFREFFPPLRL